MRPRARFVTSCVESTAELISPMVDSEVDISRRTFLKHVDREDLKAKELELGYAEYHPQGLTMARDWHVSYHKSVFDGRPCWFFRWSAIEFVFVETA